MTVRQLNNLLKTLDPKAIVVVDVRDSSAHDHSYKEIEWITNIKVVENNDRSLYEYYGPEYIEKNDKVISVLLLE